MVSPSAGDRQQIVSPANIEKNRDRLRKQLDSEDMVRGKIGIEDRVLESIVAEVPFFDDIDRKQTFLFVLGALFARIISLQKAAEIVETSADVFLELLDAMGLEFSYLTSQDIELEKNW